ncbi:MAG TPA: trehalose-6-phosphate synthase [Alphaproteobacteria bacterium]|nr:trehalose-6-phosphate synthase [Alphaproteobacteria bacterium]
MSRLIAVSNRVTVADGRPASTGGLAVGMLAALRESGGIWVGFSGETSDMPADAPKRFNAGRIDYATIDFTPDDYNGYYNGFSNSVLWPLFHYRLGLVNFSRAALAAYQRVNARFAELISGLLRADDVIWVQDYHLIPLGAELRRRGATQPIGFFLHTPFPARQVFSSLPHHELIGETLSAYDVIGFQTQRDRDNFIDYVTLELGAEKRSDGRLKLKGRIFSAEAFPIGVDADNIVGFAKRSAESPSVVRLRESLQGRDLMIGVDRLDYSKGLIERFNGFERLLARFPERRKRVTFMQIAPPTRSDVAEYNEIRAKLEASAGHINGVFAEYDWVPLRYLNRSFTRQTLAGFFRFSRVGLVTPLRDGMNLVAKEYIAAQDPEDPGVLVLSSFAGAAEQLETALIINPYDVEEMAETMDRALDMPLDERQHRWRIAMDSVTRLDIGHWRSNFIATLRGARIRA